MIFGNSRHVIICLAFATCIVNQNHIKMNYNPAFYLRLIGCVEPLQIQQNTFKYIDLQRSFCPAQRLICTIIVVCSQRWILLVHVNVTLSDSCGIHRKEIGSNLKLLVILSLAGCPRVTMANLFYLCGCVSLEVWCQDDAIDSCLC